MGESVKEKQYRLWVKRSFSRQHNTDIPHIQVRDQVFVPEGLLGAYAIPLVLYPVVAGFSWCMKQGLLKTVGYLSDAGCLQLTSMGNLLKYIPAGDIFQSPMPM